MHSLLDFSVTVILVIYVLIYTSKISNTHEVLNGLSDDINEIKKKLGLEVSARTKSQLEEANKKYINDLIKEGQSIVDIRQHLGFWGFRKYKWYITHMMKNYNEAMICPECEKVSFSLNLKLDFEQKCSECGVPLIKMTDFWSNQKKAY